jgi:hypothetical protein
MSQKMMPMNVMCFIICKRRSPPGAICNQSTLAKGTGEAAISDNQGLTRKS